jgi:Na+/melibiose symporter-like transporter
LLLSLLISALVIAGRVSPGDYALVFLISALGGAVSLAFIKRIPEVQTTEAMQLSSQRVPWQAILSYPPFRELLIFNIIYATVIGSLSVFAIEFLRDHSRFDVGTVLNLWALSFLGALVVLPFSGQMVDSIGSKPLMRANVRIAMATMPKMGANHFFALFTVITSLGPGGAPCCLGSRSRRDWKL